MWKVEPFIVGTESQCSDARRALAHIGFTEPAICAGAEVESIYSLPARGERTIGFLDASSPLSLAVQLFMDGEDVPWETVRAIFAPSDLAALEAIGLVQSIPDDASRCAAFVALYPTEGLYIASDRHARIQLVASGKPADIVYSALTPETRRFVELMPRKRCDDYLELCSGTGIAALIAARDYATRVWAVDITERSTRFAAFNAALNGLHNVTALEGDLYAPLAGRTFDMITAHPPYVPSATTAMVFRDGGEDGEQVTRQILAGLAQHLRPGGRFQCDCMMSERVGAPVEKRIRAMLGPDHGEFDVLVGEAGTIDPEALLGGSLRSGRLTVAEVAAQRALFHGMGVEQFVNVDFLIRRRAGASPAVTRRRSISPSTRAEHMDWYLDAVVAVSGWGEGSSQFLDARPRALPETELLSRSALQDGRWRITGSSLVTQAPFLVQAECPPWLATLLSWSDGSATARELLARLRGAGILDDTQSDADFAAVVSQLADHGFVELDAVPFAYPAARR